MSFTINPYLGSSQINLLFTLSLLSLVKLDYTNLIKFGIYSFDRNKFLLAFGSLCSSFLCLVTAADLKICIEVFID